VGCDGFRSSVRELAEIDFLGTRVESPWAVFDAAAEGWIEEYDLTFAHLDLPTVILTPLPGRRWRVYVRPQSDASDLVANATEVVRRYDPGVTFVDIENPVRFRCHSRVASQFKSGHVLLAGDAAHVCSPTEGHGMNTGLQDAFNLGWKLALVCRGLSGPGLLDSYEAERRPVALRVAQSGDESEDNQSLQSRTERRARDSGIRSTFADPESSHPEVVAHAELDRSYAGCGVVLGDTNDLLAPGARLPGTAPVHPFGGNACALHRNTHRANHTLLVLGGPEADTEEVLRVKRVLDATIAGSVMVDAVLGFCAPPAIAGVGQMDHSVAEQLGIERLTVLAIRPDRYVGLRLDGSDPTIVEKYLKVLSGRDSGPR
jgi:FAD binding domain-containing protein